MKWIETKVIFESDNVEFAADLISNVFHDFGFQGVVIETPDVETLENWADDAQEKPPYHAIIGYLPKDEKTIQETRILEKKLDQLKEDNDIFTRMTYREIDEEGWAESWKRYFRPEKITERIVVKPTWQDYEGGPDEMVLEIDPGMAFGTGTHPTTALCIHLLEKYVKPSVSFLDVGTGSGILMIAAAKLGADIVWGTDKDPVAVNVAKRNLLQNRIEGEKFRLFAGNLVDCVAGKFDLVAANISTREIVVLLDSIKTVLKKEGIFIGSGMTENNKDSVVKKMKESGFKIIEAPVEERWVALAGKLVKIPNFDLNIRIASKNVLCLYNLMT